MKKSTILFFVIVGIGVLSFDDAAHAREGWYLGLGIPYATVDGDFDGESGFIGPTDVIIVPEIDGGFGLELFGGYRGPAGWAGEFNVAHSKHDGEWLGASFDVNYLSVGVNFRYFFAEGQETAQPYLTGGLGYHQLEVVDGAFSGPRVGDAVYSGLGVNLGLGMDYYTHPNFSLGGGVKYRLVSYDQAEGLGDSGELDDSLKGNGFTIFFRTSYHFTASDPGFD